MIICHKRSLCVNRFLVTEMPLKLLSCISSCYEIPPTAESENVSKASICLPDLR